MTCKFLDQQFIVELNGELRSLPIVENVPWGIVNVDSSQVLTFDGFCDDTVSVSSQELSERQEQLHKWWSLRPNFIKKSRDIDAYL